MDWYKLLLIVVVFIIVFFILNKPVVEKFDSDFYGKGDCDFYNNFNPICKEYLTLFLINKPDASENTKGEFINWCHSYRRRLDYFPKEDRAKGMFDQLYLANKMTGR